VEVAEQEAAGAWWREKMSRFGKPWPEVSTLAEKTLGPKTHRFASESPGNDQFFNNIMDELPRDFRNITIKCV
jgi:hypothetical protein